MSIAKPAEAVLNSGGQVLCFSLQGAHIPPLIATVKVAEAFRSAALAAFQVITGHRRSFLLSGHHADGAPDLDHEHAFYLPVPDERGKLTAVYALSPNRLFSSDELKALRLIRILQWNGPTASMRVELAAEENTLSRVATFWSTITPYVPPRRFYGTHGKHHLRPEDQVINELAKLVPGKHAVEEIRLVPDWHIKVRVSLSSDGMLRPVKRQGFYVRLRSAMPLCGPIILGHSTHFGLGHFRPAE